LDPNYQVVVLLNVINLLQKTVAGLWEMNDRRFKVGFDVINLLDRTPKIGLDGGWQPEKPQAVLLEVDAGADGEKNPTSSTVDAIASIATATATATATTATATATTTAAAATASSASSASASRAPTKQQLAPEELRIGGEIEFTNVKFKYKGMQKDILKGASFKVEAGSFVGICGERAAGKSTLFRLMLRLYDVTDGEICIGGHPISYYNPVWLRSQIGLAKQTPAIYSRTLRENITYGAEDVLKKLGGQTNIDKHLEAVLKQASIWKHFDNREKFPQGLDTFIYGHSDRLTGGEKRSVANARALLRVTPILLLDEPTAGLDASNESKVCVFCRR
jgi:ABC-type multidrug transport system fused ATPase/permease subunit